VENQEFVTHKGHFSDFRGGFDKFGGGLLGLCAVYWLNIPAFWGNVLPPDVLHEHNSLALLSMQIATFNINTFSALCFTVNTSKC